MLKDGWLNILGSQRARDKFGRTSGTAWGLIRVSALRKFDFSNKLLACFCLFVVVIVCACVVVVIVVVVVVMVVVVVVVCVCVCVCVCVSV